MKAGWERGFTLVEAAVTMAILSVVTVFVTRTMVTTVNAQRYLTTKDLVDERLRRTAERMVNRLRTAGLRTLGDVPEAPATASSIRFRRMVDYDVTTGPVWGPEERLRHRLHELGTVDGKDDDGDGRADQGSLAWESGGASAIWCPDLVEASFSREGRDILATLRCEVVDPTGDRIGVSRRIHVTLQN